MPNLTNVTLSGNAFDYRNDVTINCFPFLILSPLVAGALASFFPDMIDPTVTPPTPDPSLLVIDVLAVSEDEDVALMVYRLPDLSTPIAEVGTDYNSYVVSDSFLLQPDDYAFVVRHQWSGYMSSSLSLGINEMEYTCHGLPCVYSLSISASGIQQSNSTVGVLFCETDLCTIYRDDITEPFLSEIEPEGSIMMIEPGSYYSGNGNVEVIANGMVYNLNEDSYRVSFGSDGSVHFECPRGSVEVVFTHSKSGFDPESFTIQQNGKTKKTCSSSLFERNVFTSCLLPGEYSLSLDDFSSSSSVTVQQCGSSLGSFTRQDATPSFTVTSECEPLVCDGDSVLVSIATGSTVSLILAEYSPRSEVQFSFDGRLPEVHCCLKKSSLFFVRPYSEDEDSLRPYAEEVRINICIPGVHMIAEYVRALEELWFSTSHGRADPPSGYHGRFVFTTPSQFGSIPSDIEVIIGSLHDCNGGSLPTLDFSSFPKLQFLALQGICSDTTSIVISGLSHLKYVSVYHDDSNEVESGSLTIKNCPSLVVVSVSWLHFTSIEIDGLFLFVCSL